MNTVPPAFVVAIVAFVKDKFTTDTAELFGQLQKLEAKIEKAIAKDRRQLSGLKDAQFSIARNIALKNTSIDRAYKLLHNVSELTR